MIRSFFVGVLVALIALGVGGSIAIRSGVIAAGADATPSLLEIWAAKTSLHATMRAEAPTTPNPVALTDDNLIAGIDLYGQHCAICHGTAKGAESISPLAKGLNPVPPQLAVDGVEDDPEGVTFWKIQHGIRWTGMPSWKGTLNDQQMWTLALFLKHMDNLPPAARQAWQDGRTQDPATVPAK